MNLDTPISEVAGIGPHYLQRLKKLEIKTVGDLLMHIPSRYEDYSYSSQIKSVRVGETVTIRGQVVSIRNQYTRTGKSVVVADISDGEATIAAIWFNQRFLLRTLPEGTNLSLSGKVNWWSRKPALISPQYEKIDFGKDTVHTGRIMPIYPETAGLTSKWLRTKIKQVFDEAINSIEELLPEDIIREFDLIDRKSAITFLHFPKDTSQTEIARRRLAFDELVLAHLSSIRRKIEWRKYEAAHKLRVKNDEIEQFISKLPFELTESQRTSAQEILADLESDKPMNRLLQGDVGSGKTIVAAVGALAAFLEGYQTVIMAPTQILAEQHFNTLNSVFEEYRMRVSLLTSTIKSSLLGRSDIFVGTHSLIAGRVSFDRVALAVIDEQHRFGVAQRAKLVGRVVENSRVPHILTMTATPIPRSVAHSLFGELDLSTLTHMPAGRQKVTTWVVPPKKREASYEWIAEQIKKDGIQVFVVCPLIEESEAESMKQVKAVTTEYEKLKKIFKGFKVGLLHGRLKPKEKQEVVDKFKKGEVDILVSTPVVEVGIDIPNATIMVIEAAERFGLASLHQLRGRVGRSYKKSYCLLFTESSSMDVTSRLTALRQSHSGAELAELDLKLRGPGEIFGLRQHGFSELKIASWSDFELIAKAKQAAEKIIKNQDKYPEFIRKLNKLLA